MWRTSRQVRLLCSWARHLTGRPHLYVEDRWPKHSLLLGFHLSRIGRIENPSCSACGHLSQDTSHLILHCPATNFLRRSLFGDSLSLRPLVQTLGSCPAFGSPWCSAIPPSLGRGGVNNNSLPFAVQKWISGNVRRHFAGLRAKMKISYKKRKLKTLAISNNKNDLQDFEAMAELPVGVSQTTKSRYRWLSNCVSKVFGSRKLSYYIQRSILVK